MYGRGGTEIQRRDAYIIIICNLPSPTGYGIGLPVQSCRLTSTNTDSEHSHFRGSRELPPSLVEAVASAHMNEEASPYTAHAQEMSDNTKNIQHSNAQHESLPTLNSKTMPLSLNPLLVIAIEVQP